jgi:hypothetical protein
LGYIERPCLKKTEKERETERERRGRREREMFIAALYAIA